uniref:Uncharacterized protein n=1 Tax=Knipowitschia caucasica TaxID=637954 RepID=A0AAV2LZM5_KNICA
MGQDHIEVGLGELLQWGDQGHREGALESQDLGDVDQWMNQDIRVVGLEGLGLGELLQWVDPGLKEGRLKDKYLKEDPKEEGLEDQDRWIGHGLVEGGIEGQVRVEVGNTEGVLKSQPLVIVKTERILFVVQDLIKDTGVQILREFVNVDWDPWMNQLVEIIEDMNQILHHKGVGQGQSLGLKVKVMVLAWRIAVVNSNSLRSLIFILALNIRCCPSPKI